MRHLTKFELRYGLPAPQVLASCWRYFEPSMHSFINEILGCLCMSRTTGQYDVLEEQPSLDFTHEKHPQTTTESLAADILSTLYAADTNDEHLIQRLQDIVHETGWYEDLAAAVLTGLENALKAGAPMGQAMKDAYEKATQIVADVLEFAKEHPVFCAVVALGILVILAPWAIEAVGFGELGPIEGMCICGGVYYANVLFACRNLCFLVAVDICRLCAGEIIVLVLPATGNGLEAEIGRISSDGRLSHIETHPKSHSGTGTATVQGVG
jgi:hypothetical protein